MQNVYDVLNDLKNVPVLIKSTISLIGWQYIQRTFLKVSFSPEFLRAESALEDFRENNTILIGGDSVHFWQEIFLNAMGNVNIDVATPEELILTKYFRNSFLATKVAFFNEIYDLCKATDTDYENVSRLIALDSRIGSSHTQVTEDRGFGGHCFPKDVSALLKMAESFKNNLNILEAANNYNKRIRK
jgi:UDPglucose 6-dehydrogenase